MAFKEFYKYTDHLTVPILFGFCSFLAVCEEIQRKGNPRTLYFTSCERHSYFESTATEAPVPTTLYDLASIY